METRALAGFKRYSENWTKGLPRDGMMRHCPRGAGMSFMAHSNLLSRFGPFELDAARGELRKGGIPLKLHPQPFRVLSLLVENPGKLITREELQHSLWNGNTFVDFDGGINFCVRQIRSTLADDAEKPRYIETIPRRGYRFIAPVEVAPANARAASSPAAAPAAENLIAEAAPVSVDVPAVLSHDEPLSGTLHPHLLPQKKTWYGKAALAGICLVLLAIAGGARYRTPAPKLTAKDTIVLANFKNATGESVFDGALNQALAVEMAQSPFLNILPERKTGQTLRMMGRSSNQEITHDVAQEICVRTGSNALVNGTVSKLGAHYLISLNAEACSSGVILAAEKAEAANKDDVLKSLSQTTASLRVKLGESLPSVQKYDVPIQATTTSLEALRNLDFAARVGAAEGAAASLPFVERALEADPNFASAYAALARRYLHLNQSDMALANATKAYQLRERVTERENFQISAIYFRSLGDVDSLNKILELWSVNYPRDPGPPGRLCVTYGFLGQYEKALTECQQAMDFDPDDENNYANLAGVYLNLNRFEDAERTCEEAYRRNLACTVQYEINFVRRDFAGMDKQVSAAEGHPGAEDGYFCLHSNTMAYFGRLRAADDYSRRAVDSARRAGLNEAAALWQANAALRNAEVGRSTEARREAEQALRLAPGKNAKVLGALALARAGNVARARKLGQELQESYPNDTLLKLYWIPVVEAAAELKSGNVAKSLEFLQIVQPYELAQPSPNDIGTMYPVYLRAEADLTNRDAGAAAREFQKILDHPGIVINFVTAPLAQLGLARAYAAQGNTVKAKAAYDEFFQLWKDADPDIPALKEAKAQYAKLF